MASKRKETEASPSKGTGEATRLYPPLYELTFKHYLNQEQKMMNMGMSNISKEKIQMLIDFSPKSWDNSFGQYLSLSEDNNAHFQIKMVDVTVEVTAEQHNITVGNPLTAFMEEKKWSFNCNLFIASYAKYLSDGLQVSNDGLDAGLLHKRYATLLWKYKEAKAQKSYTNDIKDLR
ncbi:hypothetical protein FXO38_02760 [Capsicum annuum]|nr:hypothetical protein FXO38_02760 [Capsicum annuum]KAF3681570.1 hypothetical protein FXO37_02850 [Capsicum annuum]